jgi:prepilin-type N-terminal cleavage/methylation domain-containing protein
MRSKQTGFSLIELLVVVSIILIVAAIAIPNLLRSRMAANEASAVASVRSINTSQVAYQSSYGQAFAAPSPHSATVVRPPTACPPPHLLRLPRASSMLRWPPGRKAVTASRTPLSVRAAQ